MTMPDATDTVAAPATTAAAKHAVPPPPAGAQTPDGVFLIHGLGGTQYDLGSMHKRLKNAGLVTHSLTLPWLLKTDGTPQYRQFRFVDGGADFVTMLDRF